MEAEQAFIRHGVAALLRGEIALPMAVKEFPSTEPTPEVHAAILKVLAEAGQLKPLAIESDKSSKK